METLKANRINIRPTGAPVGAEIRGVDLSQALDDEVFAQIEQAFERHGVLFFRDQQLSPEQLVRFSRRFGELEPSVLKQYLLPGHPDIVVLSNVIEYGKGIGLADAGNHWHSDSSYTAMPARASLLYGREIPSENGEPLGDTLFVCTAGVYETLPNDMRRRLDGLRAIHGLRDRWAGKKAGSEERPIGRGEPAKAPLTPEQLRIPPVVHPVVRTHPTTGRKCIYVNEGLTRGFVGLDDEEGEALLNELCLLLTRPERIYRHRWQVGDLVIWDNCSTQHHATFNYRWPEHRRLMHRTTIVGTVPV